MRCVAQICLTALLASSMGAQRWPDSWERSPAGSVARHQAVLDATCDAHALLVASHPDDRYPLPAAWLRTAFGIRVSVLLATRGGGGQNSAGPETGDALERIRTLEAEVGCAQLGCDVWYLDRPDNGFRRSAAETFAEWGREATLRDLVRLLRRIRPDIVLTTHHREEMHGHDLALVELLPEAVRLAAKADFAGEGPPHQVRSLLLGAGSSFGTSTLRIDVDQLDGNHGVTWRRMAHDVLRLAHRSPGLPGPINEVFESTMRLEVLLPTGPVDQDHPFDLPSLFDSSNWPGDPARLASLQQAIGALREQADLPQPPIDAWIALLVELRALRGRCAEGSESRSRLERRIDALERLLLISAGMQAELEVLPGTVAIAGEEFSAIVQLHGAVRNAAKMRAEGLDGIEVELEPHDDAQGSGTDSLRANARFRMPGQSTTVGDSGTNPYRGDRFVPPVRLRLFVSLREVELPVTLIVPVELRAPIELQVVPQMLLLPNDRKVVQFSVGVTRNTQFPVAKDLVVRAPAGYALRRDRQAIALIDQRRDLLGFEVEAPAVHKPGVDVLRVALGANRVVLPVHTVEVSLPQGLRVGLLRSRDDTLPGILGVGGFGIGWTELSDADVAVADLGGFDTIVVDARALRERPDARRGFRRLLEFASGKGHRLVILYQKENEFHPPGDSFLGAPHSPFHVGRARVTRADAPVRVLLSNHVLLNHPNAIKPADWDSWEQERALYLPDTYATQYQELLETQDPGQPAQRGALLYARTGEGEYVYCALALVRQLKKLHPGAVRLLANLLTPAPNP